MKQNLEITLTEDTDIFGVRDRLNKYRGIKANVVTTRVLRVWFDPQRMAAKKLVKLVRTLDSSGRKTANILHLKGLPMNNEKDEENLRA